MDYQKVQVIVHQSAYIWPCWFKNLDNSSSEEFQLILFYKPNSNSYGLQSIVFLIQLLFGNCHRAKIAQTINSGRYQGDGQGIKHFKGSFRGLTKQDHSNTEISFWIFFFFFLIQLVVGRVTPRRDNGMKDHHYGHCLSLVWSNHHTGIGCHVRVSCGTRACSCLGDCECLGIRVHKNEERLRNKPNSVTILQWKIKLDILGSPLYLYVVLVNDIYI